MPKDDNKLSTATPAAAPAPQATTVAVVATPAAEPPRLGTVISVKPAVGLQLINNETGLEFEADVATSITVTITTLRRLADGDLIIA
jgi:hypothetical protein